MSRRSADSCRPKVFVGDAIVNGGGLLPLGGRRLVSAVSDGVLAFGPDHVLGNVPVALADVEAHLSLRPMHIG